MTDILDKESHLEKAIRLIREPEPFDIKGYLKEELDKFDYKDPLAWILHRGRYEEALKELELELKENSNSAVANEMMANLLVTLGKYEESIPYYSKPIKEKSPTADHLNIGAVFEHLGNRQKAYEHYQFVTHIGKLTSLAGFLIAYPESELKVNKPGLKEHIRSWLNEQLDEDISKLDSDKSQNPFEMIKSKFQAKKDCPICQSRENGLFWNDEKNHREIRQCRNCKLIYVHPQPDLTEVKSWYGGKYFEPSFEGARKILDLWEKSRASGENNFHPTGKQFSLIFQWLESLGLKELERKSTKPLEMLDIGCATCGLMAEFINRGWETRGVELSEQAVHFDQDRDFNVVQGNIEDCGLPDNYFDLITMTHVIEHLPDPLKTLKEISRIIKVGGKLFIRTPNCESLPRLMAEKDWFGDHDHLFFYGNRTLETLLKTCNFDILGIKSYVGIDIETYRDIWDRYRFNDLLRARINQADIGDVILIYAEYKGYR